MADAMTPRVAEVQALAEQLRDVADTHLTPVPRHRETALDAVACLSEFAAHLAQGDSFIERHLKDEVNSAHLALDQLGAPKTKQVFSRDGIRKQDITIGLAERLSHLQAKAAHLAQAQAERWQIGMDPLPRPPLGPKPAHLAQAGRKVMPDPRATLQVMEQEKRMSEPITMSAVREKEIRTGAAEYPWDAVDDLVEELDATRAALTREREQLNVAVDTNDKLSTALQIEHQRCEQALARAQVALEQIEAIREACAGCDESDHYSAIRFCDLRTIMSRGPAPQEP